MASRNGWPHRIDPPAAKSRRPSSLDDHVSSNAKEKEKSTERKEDRQQQQIPSFWSYSNKEKERDFLRSFPGVAALSVRTDSSSRALPAQKRSRLVSRKQPKPAARKQIAGQVSSERNDRKEAPPPPQEASKNDKANKESAGKYGSHDASRNDKGMQPPRRVSTSPWGTSLTAVDAKSGGPTAPRAARGILPRKQRRPNKKPRITYEHGRETILLGSDSESDDDAGKPNTTPTAKVLKSKISKKQDSEVADGAPSKNGDKARHREEPPNIAAAAAAVPSAADVPPKTPSVASAAVVPSSRALQEGLSQPATRFMMPSAVPIPYTLAEFKIMWELEEDNMGMDTEDLEKGKWVDGANKKVKASDSKAQSHAMYGRILFDVTDYLLRRVLNVNPDSGELFLDIGHGIGNAVLQAAYTLGCDARGIELDSDRNALAATFMAGFELLRRIHRERDDRESKVGKIEFLRGQLQVEENREFLTSPGRIVKAFVNNYNGVFGEKSSLPGQAYHLDQFIAGLFAKMEPGSVLVTLHPLSLGLRFKDAQKQRQKHGLSAGSSHASFFEFEKVSLGPKRDVFSFSGKGKHFNEETFCYKYTRLSQDSTEGAIFQCCNKACPRAQAGTPIPATEVITVKFGRPAKKESRLVVNSTCPECKVSLRCQPDRMTGTKEKN
jgi:hypothetical protein